MQAVIRDFLWCVCVFRKQNSSHGIVLSHCVSTNNLINKDLHCLGHLFNWAASHRVSGLHSLCFLPGDILRVWTGKVHVELSSCKKSSDLFLQSSWNNFLLKMTIDSYTNIIETKWEKDLLQRKRKKKQHLFSLFPPASATSGEIDWIKDRF